MSLTPEMTPKPQLLEMLDHAQEQIAALESALAEAQKENAALRKALTTIRRIAGNAGWNHRNALKMIYDCCENTEDEK